ncbi:MAG TPA: S-adenosylmethionine:tRNA ribosyltransferase-isomerase [Chitinophagaceae bacterium]|nr:S-adenosylmethionine:tRNA ribosyltransferase-isomerase [Chitinophagaceae bacterium]
MHPKNLSIRDYAYQLPTERIAKYPLPERDASKLLIYYQGKIKEDIYRNIADHIPENSLLIFNDTKVIEARLLFQKPSGGIIEIFCLAPDEQYADITTALSQHEKVLWQCLIGGASKWKPGQILKKQIGTVTLTAKYISKKTDHFIIELSWIPTHLSFAEILHYAGLMPLPPYIKRETEPSDAERYQTIYAHANGSVAAPTAGLHFTPYIFEQLKKKNIQTDFVTLHVGAGTFKPVKSENMEGHEMHAEYIDVSSKTIERILKNIPNKIIAVGTTSLRTIESLYGLGLKIKSASSISPDALSLSQWEVYDLPYSHISAEESLQTLLDWMHNHGLERLITKTQLIIAPGYPLRIADALITNFHQSQSTLLLLVAAMIGNEWKNVYRYAMENNFRFLSYGDGCLLWNDESL